MSTAVLGLADCSSHLFPSRGYPTALKRHSALLQLSLAAVDALQHPASRTLDGMHGIEKLLLQSDADDTSICQQLIQMLNRTGVDR